jgi:diaminopimelate epimerase
LKVKFTKMHGCGNDFIVLDGINESLKLSDAELSSLARSMCDRHFGVGADGVLVLLPSTVADFRMRLFNADGSEGEMCGNGIRCAARYFIENVRRSPQVRVETLAGVITVKRIVRNGKNYYAVDMGAPKLRAADVPIIWGDPESPVLDAPIDIPGLGVVRISAVNTGVPHAVVFVEGIDELNVKELGRIIRYHRLFPRGTNVDFAEITGPNTIKVRTYERGVEDETLCCGTGATAVATVATLLNKVAGDREIELVFRGGSLLLRPVISGNRIEKVIMIGTAHNVFHGVFNPD